MNDIKEVVASNLAQLRKERAKNRVLRAKSMSAGAKSHVGERLEEELKAFLNAPGVARPVYTNPIGTTFFSDPPAAPIVNRDSNALATLAFMYPIGPRDDKTWYIVSPVLYIDQICEYNKDWENHQMRIKSVLFHAARLLTLLASLLNKVLPYPIRFDGGQVKISRNDHEYDVVWYESLRDFFIALNLLNADAYYLGGVGKSNLLENLRAAMLPYAKCQCGNVAASLFVSVEGKGSV